MPEWRTGRTISASRNLPSGNSSRSRSSRAFSRRGIRGLPSAAPIVRALIARVVCVCFRPRACVLSMSSLSSSRDSPFASPFCSLFAGLRAFRHATRQECINRTPLRSSARSSRASSVYASDPNLAVKAMQLEAFVVLFSSPFGTALDDGAWPGRGNHGTPSKRTSSL